MARLIVTTPAPEQVLGLERLRFAKFAATEAEPAYRQVAADLYRYWSRWNVRYFKARLAEPHITLAVTGPRSLGYCKQLTDYGGQLQITIDDRIVFGHNRRVNSPWPAEGNKRFVRDVLLHETIHQWQIEVTGKHETGYRGHGPTFCAMCNRIAEDLGLPPVVVRRRGRKHRDRPVCSAWPQNVRPEGYYLGDVEEPTSQRAQIRRRSRCDEIEILLAAILGYLGDGRITELRDVLEQELVRLRSNTANRTTTFLPTVPPFLD